MCECCFFAMSMYGSNGVVCNMIHVDVLGFLCAWCLHGSTVGQIACM